jgi:spermidine synthase
VRSRDGGLALEVNGTWASWQRPGRSDTGSVWDALAVPLLALPVPRRRRARALILGLGAGSTARVLRAVAPEARLVGVERSAAVLRIARARFGLDLLDIEVHLADASRFLTRTRRRFDLVIEDVFIGAGAVPRKPPWLPRPGLERASRCVAPGGVLVSNSLDEAAQVCATQCDLWPHVLELRVEGFDNRIFAGSQRCLDARRLRRALASEPGLAEIARVLRLRTLARGGRR